MHIRIPDAWAERLAGCHIQAQRNGASGAAVLRVERNGGPAGFLKSEPADAFSELPDEVARLRWLKSQGLPAPDVLDAREHDGRHWLWMTAVPGMDLEAVSALAPQQAVTLLADALQQLHQVPITACPFDHRLPHRLAAARARMDAGRVDASDFDAARLGQSPEQLFAELVALTPAQADLVLTHGDACLPNLLAAHGRFSGFIDCARLGVADRHQDLALAARSIASDIGEQWVTPFFERYGIVPDATRLAFYCLLDEFF